MTEIRNYDMKRDTGYGHVLKKEQYIEIKYAYLFSFNIQKKISNDFDELSGVKLTEMKDSKLCEI